MQGLRRGRAVRLCGRAASQRGDPRNRNRGVGGMTSVPTFVSDGPRGVTGLGDDAYHDHPAVGSSHLKSIARSPAHYWSEWLDPSRPPRTDTPAKWLGKAVHAAILEPERFKSDYVVGPRFDRRTKAGKEAAAAFE